MVGFEPRTFHLYHTASYIYTRFTDVRISQFTHIYDSIICPTLNISCLYIWKNIIDMHKLIESFISQRGRVVRGQSAQTKGPWIDTQLGQVIFKFIMANLL